MEDGAALQAERFVPGETIFFSVFVENQKVGANGRVELKSEVEAFDSRGVSIAPKVAEDIKTTLQDEDKDWKPKIRAQLQLPAIARPGEYVIRYKVVDVQTGQSAAGERKFPVTGMNIERAETLVIRDFGFYRGEEDATALTIPAYRPGDTLWARFFLTGYGYGPENAIDVAYDVAVLNAEGKQIFEQKDAAVERSQAHYPQPWIPGGMNLSLQANMRPGTYTLVITGRDTTGKQTVSEKHEFRLE